MTAAMASRDIAAELQFKWNLNDVDVRTKTVERTLAPLVNEVTTLANHRHRSKSSANHRGGGKRAKAKKARELLAALDVAIQNFIERGSNIIRDNPQAADQLSSVLDEVRVTGGAMVAAASDFCQNPCSAQCRSTMVKHARALLTAVTRLLVVADMIDVRVLLNHVQAANAALIGVHNAQNQQELNERLQRFREAMDELNRQTGLRAADLRDDRDRDDLQAARAILVTNTPMLYSASKAVIRHPENEFARKNRDGIENEIQNALDAMRELLDGGKPGDGQLALVTAAVGALMAELDRFTQEVYIEPSSFDRHKHRAALEAQLEQIVSGAAAVADSGHTRDSRKEKIVQECNNLRQALQDLLGEYERNGGNKAGCDDLDLALVQLGHRATDLKRHLRRAMVDHISDAFLDTRVPLLLLVDAARRGDVEGTENAAVIFDEHAAKLVEVSQLAVAMTSSEEGARIVRYAALVVERLAPQVVTAARLLAQKPDSRPAQENMAAFQQAWEERVNVLTMAVDAIVSVDDFLAVSEMHIAEDIRACVQALHVKDADTLDRTAGAIRGRSLRVCDVVDNEMQLHDPMDPYTERVKHTVRRLRTDVLHSFASNAERAVGQLQNGEDVDTDEFIDTASCVHDAVREIRHALLMNRHPHDIDSDEEYEEGSTTAGGSSSRRAKANHASQQNNAVPSDEENQRALMRQLPVEEKKKIKEEIDVFKVAQTKFEREVAQWDETGNDIVVLAKYMCMIMMEMTDFTRGRGPLQTTPDVINAAQKISEAGTKLNALAKHIADECVQSKTNEDLKAYMAQITLYCHQLNITSRVKADVQQVGDELIVSGLESATSLIQTARNLLNSVVLTVKSAYIASTMYPSKKQSQLVVWKMRAPAMKPLTRPDVPAKPQGIIRRTSMHRQAPPMKQMAEFDAK